MEDTVIEVKLQALQDSMNSGFARMQTDIAELKADVKVINAASLDRRLEKLEKWRDTMGSRLWAFIAGGTIAVIAAWAAFFMERIR